MKEGKEILEKMYQAMPDAMRNRKDTKFYCISKDMAQKLIKKNGKILKSYKGIQIIYSSFIPRDTAGLI